MHRAVDFRSFESSSWIPWTMTAHFGIDLLKMRDKFWAEASESSCVENISNLIGYQSYTQNFLKMYSRKLLQIVQRGEYLFFFKKCLNLKSNRQLESFPKSTWKDTKSGIQVSESLWWFHWCWWQNLYFGDIRSTTSLKDWIICLVKSVTNIFNDRRQHRCHQSYRWIMIDPFFSWWSHWTNNCMYGWQFWSARMVPF